MLRKSTKSKSNGLLFVIYFAMGLFFIGIFIMAHENVHKEIYRGFGCRNVSITHSFGKSETKCQDTEFFKQVSPEDWREMRKLHAWNEIISYNIQILYIFMFYVFAFLLMILKYK